jgi:hypothetical protein
MTRVVGHATRDATGERCLLVQPLNLHRVLHERRHQRLLLLPELADLRRRRLLRRLPPLDLLRQRVARARVGGEARGFRGLGIRRGERTAGGMLLPLGFKVAPCSSAYMGGAATRARRPVARLPVLRAACRMLSAAIARRRAAFRSAPARRGVAERPACGRFKLNCKQSAPSELAPQRRAA